MRGVPGRAVWSRLAQEGPIHRVEGQLGENQADYVKALEQGACIFFCTEQSAKIGLAVATKAKEMDREILGIKDGRTHDDWETSNSAKAMKKIVEASADVTGASASLRRRRRRRSSDQLFGSSSTPSSSKDPFRWAGMQSKVSR